MTSGYLKRPLRTLREVEREREMNKVARRVILFDEVDHQPDRQRQMTERQDAKALKRGNAAE